MPAERAGYTVTMFLIDVSPSMGKRRMVQLPKATNGDSQELEMTNLEWSLQYVKLKIQEMIFNGRKTDQCGVILFGTDETDNVVNEANGDYEHVTEFIPVAQPNAGTIAKLSALQPSEDTIGDPLDALVVGIDTQDRYLANKRTWTRKIILVTDGENPIEIEQWDDIATKMNELNIDLTIVGVDFDSDDETFPFKEEDKSEIKQENEKFYRKLEEKLNECVMGTCAFAIHETQRPESKTVKSALMGTVLRIGDTETRQEEALEIMVKTSKCTALARPKSWKKFGKRKRRDQDADEIIDAGPDGQGGKVLYSELKMKTEYVVDKKKEEDDDETEDEKMDEIKTEEMAEKVEKEDLVRGFKYGQSFVPVPDGTFPKLNTKKGIDVCGFIEMAKFRRELAMGEVYYIWADPASPLQQVALSSIAQAMDKKFVAIARWVSKDGADPRMGVLWPSIFDAVHCLLWVQMPFADDVRKYAFASLDNLINKKGEKVTEHPYLPTNGQSDAMDRFVDAMDLMEANVDEEGNAYPWFETHLSFNPAIHRTKQALFHSAVVDDLDMNPLPPPHHELVKYFEPPRRMVKRARKAINDVTTVMQVKEVTRKIPKLRKGEHIHVKGEEDDMLLLDKMDRQTRSIVRNGSQSASQATRQGASRPVPVKKFAAGPSKRPVADVEGSDTEPESDDDAMLVEDRKPDIDQIPTPEPERQSPSQSQSQPPVQSQSQSLEQEPSLSDLDPRRGQGLIIGYGNPLRDFKKELEKGDLVTKAIGDLRVVILDLVAQPFSIRRKDELIACMKAMRDTALKEDEIEQWNEFMKGLKDLCVGEGYHTHIEFWDEVKNHRKELNLISAKEAVKEGGTSEVSTSEAAKFFIS